MNHIANKMIRPTTIPQTLEALKIEQAIAREALRLSFQQHKNFAVSLKGIKKEKRITIVMESLEKIGIINMSERLVGSLSVGESTIVSIMRSIITDPPILLMDEPTEGLDPVMAEMILSLIRGYSLLNNKTILITTHDNRILSIADRIIQVQQQIP